jgi:hypothetical protein
MRIVETDNFDGDYPNEKFVNLPPLTLKDAQEICKSINAACSGENAPRYWKIVDDNYKLRPGFEP